VNPAVFVSVSVIILAYGILKVNLFDIDLVVKKSFSYTIITVAIALIFLVSENALSKFISESILVVIPLSDLLSGVIATVLFMPLKNFSNKITDKIFPDVGYISTSQKPIEIYRKLIEFAEMGLEFATMLKELRSFLGISEEDHERLEQEIISDRK